jgi:hypothetical protein
MPELGWYEAIVEVLRGSAEPLHYVEIAEAITRRKLRERVGATPAQTVAATLSVSLREEAGTSPFLKVGRGLYTLRSKVAAQPPQPIPTTPLPEEGDDEAGLINAFGMYWRREWVSWDAAHLWGRQQSGSNPVDFAGQRGVYLLHDRREVVYVGRTTDQPLAVRLKQHITDRLNGRWDRFSWFGIYPVAEDGNLKATEASIGAFTLDNLIATMEALLIEGLEPPQNRKRGDGFGAVEFLQLEDPALEKKRMQELIEKFKQKFS